MSTPSTSWASAARSTAPADGVELLARDGHQRVDRLVEPPGLRDDRLERGARSSSASLAVDGERELGAGAHAGDRRAQLVRDLAGEALLVAA